MDGSESYGRSTPPLPARRAGSARGGGGFGAGAASRGRRYPRWFRRLCLFAGVVLSWNLYMWRVIFRNEDGTLRNPFRLIGKGSLPGLPRGPRNPVVTFGTMGTEHSVKKYGAGVSGLNVTGAPRLLETASMFATPEPWDSSLCMEHWGRKELLTEVDPKGYVVFVNGAEQLGGNKYLLADGLFIAKMLGRTLVEYPAKDARISVANATIGLGAYWDLSAMCMNHRILDLRAFRGLVERGLVLPEDFVTIETGKQEITTKRFKHAKDVRKFYKDKIQYGVIVMERTWKSHLNRRTMAYLHPNPFYYGLVRMLLVDHEDFANGNFLAVQWRTETATGNMAECYEQVRDLIEEQRRLLGLTVDQVLFSTDMYGSASGTYHAAKQKQVGGETIVRIKRDYPRALDNRLHDFFNRIQDTGIKAIVSGLVMAQARVLLASSLNKPGSKASPEAGVCGKPYSGYIQLIANWRTELFRKDPDTVVRLFPFGDTVQSTPVTSTDSDNVVELDGEEGMSDVVRVETRKAEEKKKAEGLGKLSIATAAGAAAGAEAAAPVPTTGAGGKAERR
ncbi:unnamed protein product [Pylaiella littoralis]